MSSKGKSRIMSEVNHKLVVVLGMHRSGTSALTRGLQVLGVELGDSLLPAQSDNEKGFWEDREINAFNIRLMQALDHDWHIISPLSFEVFSEERLSAFKAEAKVMLNKKISGFLLFGIKDPRVSVLLQFWQQVFDEMCLDVSYVIALRNPLSVAHSLARRNNFAHEKSHYLWLKYMLASLLYSQGRPKLVVDFDRLIEHPATELSRMAEFLGVDFSEKSMAYIEYRRDFLETSLRHTVYDVQDTEQTVELSDSGNLLYGLLYRLADGTLAFDCDEYTSFLSQITTQYSAQTPALKYMDRVDKQIEEFHKVEQELRQNIDSVQGQLQQQSEILSELLNSHSWQLTRPLRATVEHVRLFKAKLMSINSMVQWHGGYRCLFNKIGRVLKNEGVRGLYSRYVRQFIPKGMDYKHWLSLYGTVTAERELRYRERMECFELLPTFSILIPVYNAPENLLREALNSVIAQIYPHWELCLADDCSTDVRVRAVLEEYQALDSRIKVVFREQNGHISAATNSALTLASGDYIALMDNDDLLPPDALFWIAQEINAYPESALIYSDEDKISEDGQHRFGPYFKPDWNPQLFMAQNLISHLGVYRTDIARSIDGFRVGMEGSQDWDFAFRFIEQIKPEQIRHVPRILYHWRAIAGSTAMSSEEKPYALLAGVRAVNDHIRRKGIAASADVHPSLPFVRVSYKLPVEQPLVSLIIPTRNGLEVLKPCIESIYEKTIYRNYEVIVIDNGSDDVDTLNYLATVEAERQNFKVLRDDGPFNYSAINNRAVRQARGDYIVLINNDIEVITPTWLNEMMGHVIQPGVGAVGSRLWYPDNTLQHGGVLLNKGVASHAHKYLSRNQFGYCGRAVLPQNMIAVTAACLLVKKSVFEEVGGFDEENLTISFNDIDLCLKLYCAGYLNVWTPFAELYHHESKTRGLDNEPEKRARFHKEVAYMKRKWKSLIGNDPYYNPNLCIYNDDFSLADKPRIAY